MLLAFQFKDVNHFAYLGVNILPNIKDVVNLNYDILMESITSSVNRWTQSPYLKELIY